MYADAGRVLPGPGEVRRIEFVSILSPVVMVEGGLSHAVQWGCTVDTVGAWKGHRVSHV
jgi:hypothetical protein